jgi:hypothetical protein
MRYALLLTPLLPLALAAILAGGHVRDTVTAAVRDMPAVEWPVLRDYRLTAVMPDGTTYRITLVTAPAEPRVHVHADGSWSVGVLGVLPVAETLPPGWIYVIEPVD